MAFPVNRFLVSILCIISFPFRTISASLPPASTLLPSNADWDITVQRGKYVFAQLESGCYPDDPNPPTLEELRAHGWTLGEPGSVEPWPPKRELYEYFPKWVMRAINMDSPDFYNPILQHGTGEDWKMYTAYSNSYSPRYRLIAELSYNKIRTETLTWSTATFAVWKALADVLRIRIDKIDWIGQAAIDDPFTNSIINRAVPATPNNVIKSFGPSDQDENFMALLGTPNGLRGANLLLKHKQALGRKTITRVVVFRDGPGAGGRPDQPHLLFPLRTLRLDDGQGAGTSDFCITLNQSVPLSLIVES